MCVYVSILGFETIPVRVSSERNIARYPVMKATVPVFNFTLVLALPFHLGLIPLPTLFQIPLFYPSKIPPKLPYFLPLKNSQKYPSGYYPLTHTLDRANRGLFEPAIAMFDPFPQPPCYVYFYPYPENSVFYPCFG